MNRREMLLSTLVLPFLQSHTRSADANIRIMEAVWEGARDQFYDPNMRGVDWNAVRAEFLPKARKCSSKEKLLTELREMLSRLRNSHIFLYTDQEWEWRWNILPVCFDRCEGRVFIRHVLCGKERESERLAPFEVGDEILSADGIPAQKVRPVTLARLDPVRGNPNFGPPGSVAEVEIRRDGARQIILAKRVARPSGFEAMVTEHPTPNTLHFRFFTLGSGEMSAERLGRIWQEVTIAKGLVLDLRNCVGGDSVVSNFIAGSLLGPSKPLFRTIPRQGKETLDWSDAHAPRFAGPVAVITNSNTESQAEILAAICKEYDRARIFGERTAGAFNGWTLAISLPEEFAKYAVPFTRSISPKGIEYEGRGIEPDEPMTNSVRDYEAHRDRPLLAAIRYLKQRA